jgi:hypothetical protein
MEMCYKILGEGKPVSQRELFYKLLSDSPKYFSTMRHVSLTIQGMVWRTLVVTQTGSFWSCIYLCMTSDCALFSLCRCSVLAPMYKAKPRNYGIKQGGTYWAAYLTCGFCICSVLLI